MQWQLFYVYAKPKLYYVSHHVMYQKSQTANKKIPVEKVLRINFTEVLVFNFWKILNIFWKTLF